MNDRADKTSESTPPTYLENDMPRLFKLFLWGIVIWGVVFSLYFLLSGYNSEKRFDAKVGRLDAPAPVEAPTGVA